MVSCPVLFQSILHNAHQLKRCFWFTCCCCKYCFLRHWAIQKRNNQYIDMGMSVADLPCFLLVQSWLCRKSKPLQRCISEGTQMSHSNIACDMKWRTSYCLLSMWAKQSRETTLSDLFQNCGSCVSSVCGQYLLIVIQWKKKLSICSSEIHMGSKCWSVWLSSVLSL